VNREGVWSGKGERAGGSWPNGHLPPVARTRTEVEGEGLGRWRPAGLPATAADGEGGGRKRATRGLFSHPHLGLGCAVEADRGRRRTGGGGARGRQRCGARGCKVSSIGAVWGGEEVVAAFYRRRRSVPGQKIFPAILARAPAGWASAAGPAATPVK
jgi:hypothetical protein